MELAFSTAMVVVFSLLSLVASANFAEKGSRVVNLFGLSVRDNYFFAAYTACGIFALLQVFGVI